MKVVDIAPNTPEWLEMRRGKIGASDIGILMTGSPSEIKDLYEAKVIGKEKFVTDHMRRGIDLEPLARKFANETLEADFHPKVAVHDSEDWLMASFDGIDVEKKSHVEIKCPANLVENLSDYDYYDRWMWQIQAQLAVSGYERAWLMVMTNGTEKRLFETVERNEKKISQLFLKGKEFMEKVRNFECPVNILDSLTDIKTVGLVERRRIVLRTIKELQAEIDDIEAALYERNNGNSYQCEGVTVRKVERKGVVDYKKIPELKGVDLEQYRKSPTTYWSITGE